jgi:hypothetical protein
VREVAGGEGQGAREHKEVKAHLLVCLKGARGGRRGLIDDEAVRGGGVNVDGDVPTGEWRGEIAG